MVETNWDQVREWDERYRCRAAKLIMVTVAASLGTTGVVYAADDQLSAAPSDQLTEITVTATRRSTTVQTTPISITALTADQIASRGIVDVDSLVSSVPDIAVRNTGGPGEMEFEIRGLNSQGGNSSMVGMYLGEIPLSTAMGSQLGKNSMDPGLYDLQRVEVLSGPQGTLYGSSSMGGTIRLIPTAPQLNTYAASTQEVVSGTVSNGGINHQENGMVNLPLGDTAAVRIVGSFIDDSGWVNRLVLADGTVPVDTGVFPNVTRPSNFYSAPLQESLNGVNTTRIDSIRVSILWQPMENLTIEPMVMYQSIQQGAPPTVDVNGNSTHPQVPAVWAHYEVYDAPEPQTDSLSFGSLTMTYQLPFFSLTSATGFWHRNFDDLQDETEQVNSAIGIPVYDPAGGGIGPNYSSKGPGMLEQDSSRQLSEEFRIASSAPGPFQWVAGYFYQNLKSEVQTSVLAPQATPILGGTALSDNIVPEDLIQNAVYGNVSWRLSPHFEVTAGFRHYHYSLSETSTEHGLFTPLGAEGLDVPYNAANSTAASGTAPSFTLTYNIDPDHMVYARIGKGFRLGGVSTLTGPIPVVAASNTNPLFASDVANECGLQAKILLTTTCNPKTLLQAPTTFSSDSLWSYELGEKSSFFDHRLIANLDAYLEDWYNPQVATNLAGYGLTVNGGNARIKGVEGQLQALLPGGFDFSLNASYTDAKFIESSAVSGFPAGTQIPDTPKVSGSAVLQWKHPLVDDLSLFGSLEEDYTGNKTDLPFGLTATLQNMDQLLVHLPAYAISNFRFGVRGERNGGDHWSAALFVNNFTNKHVLLDPQPQIALQTSAFERYVINQPLTAGIDVSYAFR
jgi:outer membrane receptor protein involved in Fe transport